MDELQSFKEQVEHSSSLSTIKTTELCLIYTRRVRKGAHGKNERCWRLWALRDPILRGGLHAVFCNTAPLPKMHDFEAILAE